MFLFENETWLRLLPLRRFFKLIDPDLRKRIIDIGAGTGRLELALKRKNVCIYDTNAEAIKIANQYFDCTFLGKDSKLEFKDNSYDWAISIHTLEHVPRNEREQFLMEMVRISREGIYLNFPEGEYAEKLCHNYLNSLSENGKEPNKWTVEHLENGIPLIKEIKEILKKQDKFIISYKFIRNYHAEKFYWSEIKASDNLNKKYFFSPFNSLKRYINYSKKPSVELLLIGIKPDFVCQDIILKL
jgi:ubiquinone/menaquinone biosynthesis C-methylase UbiE